MKNNQGSSRMLNGSNGTGSATCPFAENRACISVVSRGAFRSGGSLPKVCQLLFIPFFPYIRTHICLYAFIRIDQLRNHQWM